MSRHRACPLTTSLECYSLTFYNQSFSRPLMSVYPEKHDGHYSCMPPRQIVANVTVVLIPSSSQMTSTQSSPAPSSWKPSRLAGDIDSLFSVKLCTKGILTASYFAGHSLNRDARKTFRKHTLNFSTHGSHSFCLSARPNSYAR